MYIPALACQRQWLLSVNRLAGEEDLRSGYSPVKGGVRVVRASERVLSTGTSWVSIGAVLLGSEPNSELWQPGLKDEVVPTTTHKMMSKGAAVTVFITVPCLTVVCLSTCAVIDLTHIEGRLSALESSWSWKLDRFLMVFNVFDMDCDRNSDNSMIKTTIETLFGIVHASSVQIIASCASSTLASPDSLGAGITAPHGKISNALTLTMVGHTLRQNIWQNCETAANASLDRQDRCIGVDQRIRYDDT
jgi:hypothetical protein